MRVHATQTLLCSSFLCRLEMRNICELPSIRSSIKIRSNKDYGRSMKMSLKKYFRRLLMNRLRSTSNEFVSGLATSSSDTRSIMLQVDFEQAILKLALSLNSESDIS